jgi:hypothetical protein
MRIQLKLDPVPGKQACFNPVMIEWIILIASMADSCELVEKTYV